MSRLTTTAAARALGTSLARQDAALDESDPLRVPRRSLSPSDAIDGWEKAARECDDGDLLVVTRSARRRRTVEVAWARELDRQLRAAWERGLRSARRTA